MPLGEELMGKESPRFAFWRRASNPHAPAARPKGRPAGSLEPEVLADLLDAVAEEAADGQGEDPRPDDALDDAPLDGAEALHRAHAHDRGGNDVGGGNRDAERRG